MIKENTVKTIAISINNKTVHMDKNWTVLQACEKIGLFIPRFCYSESLSIAGNCRMCLVEIEKSPKLMPSCAIKINEGMKIHTKTNLVKKTRENILEFLLINHPLDCPICDQGGECDLQDQAMIYGSDRGRFKEYKRSVQDKNAGPLIKTIMTRCIHCTRCIRFATEVAGIESLGTTGRGKTMEVGSYITKLFSSELSGNIIDLCPVGALTSKPYAFTVRPWELKSVESIDVLDGTGSNLRLDARGSELMRVLPRANDLINQQWISDKTRFSYDGLKNQRLHSPISVVKTETGQKNYKAMTWKESLVSLQKGIQAKSKEGKEIHIKGIVGPFIDQETLLSFKNLLNRLGSSGLYLQSAKNYLNFGNINMDQRENYLLSWNETLEASAKNKPDLFLIIGCNPRFEASTLNVRLRKLVLQSSVSSTGDSDSIKLAYIGSPMDLTYPSSHIGTGPKDLSLLSEGKHPWSIEFLKSSRPLPILGFSALQRKDGSSVSFMTQKLSFYYEKIKKTLISSEQETYETKDIESLFGSAASVKPLSSTNKWFSGKHTDKLLTSILHPYASTAGALDLGFYPGKSSQLFDDVEVRSQKKESFDCLFLLGADSKEDYLKDDFSISGSERPFVVYQGHHGDIGAKQADLILPSTSYVEKKATYVNTEGLVQQTDTIGAMQVDSPTGNESHDDWKIVHALSTVLNSEESKTLSKSGKSLLDSFESVTSEGREDKLVYRNCLIYLRNNLSHSNPNASVTFDSKLGFKENKKKTLSNKKALEILSYGSELYRLNNSIQTKPVSSVFESIAPHLDSLDDISVSGPYKASLEDSGNKAQSIFDKDLSKSFSFEDTNFVPLFDNFYQTDVISKASVSMGKSSLSFKNQAWPF